MKEPRDPYLGFAGHYDLHGWDWYAQIYGPKLFRLLEERGFTGARVLDAGCGTGTLALALSERGYRVTGVDVSGAMLDAARSKDARGAVAWRLGEITTLDLPGEGPFDVVTCVSDTINHLESLEEWERAMVRFAAHLRPGGALYLDAMTSLGLQRLDKFGVAESDGRTLIVGIVYEPATRRSTLKVTSFIPANEGPLYEKATDTITEWGQPVDEVYERLRRAGFEEIERLWPAVEDPELDDRLIVFARRR